MKAVVLCAGRGERLAPITDEIPKPALTLLGSPLLRHPLRAIARAGIRQVGINVHHLAKEMRACAEAEAHRAHLSLTVSVEAHLQGTGGALAGFAQFLGDSEDFILTNGDTLFDFALAPVIAYHRARAADATMVLMPADADYRTVEVDSEGWVRRIAGFGAEFPGLSAWHFAGVHVVSPRVLQWVRGAEDINHDVYPRLLERGGRIAAFHVPVTRWFDVGTAERYLAVQREILGGRAFALEGATEIAQAGQAPPGVFTHPRAYVARGATVLPPAYFAEECEVAAGAVIGPNVAIGRKASIAASAELADAAVLDGAFVDGTFIHAIVGRHGLIRSANS